MRNLQRLIVLTLSALAAGCATQAPVEQVQLFSRAFANLQAANQPLFDDLAVAERRQGRDVAVSRAHPDVPGPALGDIRVSGPAAPSVRPQTGTDGKPAQAVAGAQTAPGGLEYLKCKEDDPNWQAVGPDRSPTGLGFIRGFCLEDASYFSDLGDPPTTHAFRTGMAVLGKYSEVLVTLAEGRNIEEAKAQIQGLGSSVAAGLAMVPGAQAAAALVAPVLSALGPVIEAAAQANNSRELKRLVVEASPHFSRLVFALQASSREIFLTLIEAPVAQATPGNLTKNPQLGQALVTQIEGYRKVVSDYAVLLAELEEAHKDLVEALKQDAPQRLTLGAVAERAQRLNVQADSLRRAYVILRRGTAQ